MGAGRVLIRCEAGPGIGGGHVMRCLALAEALAEAGAEPALCVNPGAAHTAPALTRSGFCIVTEPDQRAITAPKAWADPADWVVIDRYAPDPALLHTARNAGGRVAVFHELAAPAPAADLLIDPSPGARASAAPRGVRLLKGPSYALIRKAVRDARPAALRRNRGALDQITLSLGLVDPGGCTIEVARVLSETPVGARKTLVLGPAADPNGRIEDFCRAHGWRVLVDPDDLIEVLAASDLVIGAGGGAALERCALGVPSLLLVLAENQRSQAEAIAASGAAELAADIEGLPAAIARLSARPEALQSMAHAAAAFCDGDGARRVASALAGAEQAA